MNMMGSHWKVLSRGMAMIQARDSKDLNQIGSTSELGLNTRYILTVEFADELEVRFGKKKGLKDDSQDF